MRSLMYKLLILTSALLASVSWAGTMDIAGGKHLEDSKLGARFNKQDFGLEALKNLIKAKQPRRISELLDLSGFPKEMKSNSIRINFSESIQCSTPAAPRVILFMGNGSLICSFNSGNPADYLDHPLGEACLTTINQMECLAHETNGDTSLHTFEFLPEKQFDSQFARPSEFDEELTDTLGLVKHYQNPSRCAACHMGNKQEWDFDQPRMIYDGYFVWPNASGVINDNSIARLNTDQSDLATYIAKKIPSKDLEDDFIYLKTRSENPRYSKLPIQSTYSADHAIDDPQNAFFEDNPHLNFKFNLIQLTSTINRWIKMMSDLPRLNDFKPLMAMSVRGCFAKSPSFQIYGKELVEPEGNLQDWLAGDSEFSHHLKVRAQEIEDSLYSEVYLETERVINRLQMNYGKEALKKGRMQTALANKLKSETWADRFMLNRFGPESSFRAKNRSHALLTYLIFESHGYPISQLSPTYGLNLAFSFGTIPDATVLGGAIQDTLKNYFKEITADDFRSFSCEELRNESENRLKVPRTKW